MSESDANPSAVDASMRSGASGGVDHTPESVVQAQGDHHKSANSESILQNGPRSNGNGSSGGGPTKVRLERKQELEHKLKSNPTDLEGFLELAAIYRGEQRPLEAKRLLKQASTIFPDDENVRWQLEEAILARSLQQFREVNDLATRLNTPEADRELERSRSDWAMRRIEVCRARLQRDPSLTALQMVMAEAKYDAELFEEAFEDAGELLDLDEFSPTAHFLRARCLMALGKDLPAMKELRAVAMRRAVVAPTNLRLLSLKILCELSEKLALDATAQQYREQWKRLEESSSQQKREQPS